MLGPREGLRRDGQRPRTPEEGLVLHLTWGLGTQKIVNPRRGAQEVAFRGLWERQLRVAPGPCARPQGWAPRAWFGRTGPA